MWTSLPQHKLLRRVQKLVVVIVPQHRRCHLIGALVLLLISTTRSGEGKADFTFGMVAGIVLSFSESKN